MILFMKYEIKISIYICFQELKEVGKNGNGINPFKELLKWCAFKMSDHTFPAIGLGTGTTI